MKRDFGFVFANLFDTMMAARILGIREVGLGSLLQNEFGITLDKRYQRANWGQRPLPEELLEYARQDTHHLIPLRDRLYEQLNSKDLLDLAAEDFERVGALDGRATFAEPESSIQFNGAHDLTPQQLAVLQELCGYRDRAAYDMDRPLFKVIGNDTLIAIAKSCPAKFEDLRHIPGMTNGQLHRHGRSLLSAVQRGLQAKPIQPLRPPRPDGHYLARLDALRQWRKSTAIQWQVESDVVLPREVMVAIAEQNPMTHEQLSGAMACTPWRFEHFGSQILAALKD